MQIIASLNLDKTEPPIVVKWDLDHGCWACNDFFFALFSLSQVPSGPDFITKPELRNKVLGRGGDWTPVVSDWMIDILREGLGTRIEMLCVKQQPVKEARTMLLAMMMIIIS